MDPPRARHQPDAEPQATPSLRRAPSQSRPGASGEAEPQANAARTGGAPTADAEPRVGESGRWFRPAKAEAGFLAIPADEQADIGRMLALSLR